MNDMNHWLREYIQLWNAYHRERLQREALDRWLFFAIGATVGFALGAVLMTMLK